MAELEAVDWFRQRADAREDKALEGILLHQMLEEMEHATMALEWIPRNSVEFGGYSRGYMTKEGGDCRSP